MNLGELRRFIKEQCADLPDSTEVDIDTNMHPGWEGSDGAMTSFASLESAAVAQGTDGERFVCLDARSGRRFAKWISAREYQRACEVPPEKRPIVGKPKRRDGWLSWELSSFAEGRCVEVNLSTTAVLRPDGSKDRRIEASGDSLTPDEARWLADALLDAANEQERQATNDERPASRS